MLGRCVRRALGSLSSSTHPTHAVLYLTVWSRNFCWNKFSLAVEITLFISYSVELNKGVLLRFIFLLIKLNLWLKRKLWLCQTQGIGMWRLGISGILTLIKLSFPNWILRWVLPHFCRANVFFFFVVFLFSPFFFLSPAVSFFYWCAA